MGKKGGRKGHWQQIQSGEYPETKTDYGDSSALNWRPENDKPLPDEKGQAESTYSKLKRKSLSKNGIKKKPLPPARKLDFSSFETTNKKTPFYNGKRNSNSSRKWPSKSPYFPSAPSTEKDPYELEEDLGPWREVPSINASKSKRKAKVFPTFKEASEYARKNPGFKLTRTNGAAWKVVG
jgi:hypothetical protein